ncbi:hypothetical protein [Xenorhabdus griffiniae]|uniref:Uncharacterized protein n=1 Tax=Xenorhabdus griffiniae TaxID=351672 RepID=A0ABY9XKJ8_9GAMM|nr:hypothetical protein [Xenorhabdus griffiniae]MBD1228577.1 hypothetical protein [Xenorhabdus griffiniae]MBE8588686.1 hypothetical protein [Xenorhabdus griffiniae]WMV73464.1 hypothetical protein QL128_05410 [Xenorhabdus griffiniae]WNH03143.1 hypothetical protein QL112_005415 [Xenorhabdus griffiniae]
MKDPKPKPLACVFENPPMSVALDLLNATEPPFKVTAKHLELWFKEGVIGRYRLTDDIRDLWFKEGLGYLFSLHFGEAEKHKYLAVRFGDSEWNTAVLSGIDLSTGEINKEKAGKKSKMRSYRRYMIDDATELYASSKNKNKKKKSGAAYDENQGTEYIESATFPMPEPVIPRFELEKLYAIIHNIPLSENKPTKKNKPESQLKDNKISAKKFNTLARFTKAVLYAAYDSDTAEYPRRELDNPDSGIRQDLRDRGVAHLDGRKIQDYLREAAIEITPFLESVDIKMVNDK